MGSTSRERIAAVREFNRFYTSRIGVLDEAYLASQFSLSEVRVLYELAHRDSAAASELGRDLGIDPGYLSRMLRGFSRRGLLTRRAAKEDARKAILRLTARGKATVAPLETKARDQIAAMLSGVPGADQERLVASMRTIERALRQDSRSVPRVTLRSHRPGDIGWVVERHGTLYAEEYGWDESFEALVADGVGSRLVDECIRFARAAGYREITLWTNDVLVAARGIYERAGFELIESQRHRSFGKALVGQNWTLRL